ncbi:MAG: M1 family metallopeptidase [Anaerolineae bacterium]|nr:M1 family metallopeptidase [Anaerolineae bacterium]
MDQAHPSWPSAGMEEHNTNASHLLSTLPPEPWKADDLRLFEYAMIPAARGDVAQVVTALHPTRYQMDLRFDPVAYTVIGREIVHYTNTEGVPLDAVYFRLFPNLPGLGWAAVSMLTVDRIPVTPRAELEGSALRVPLQPPLSPGNSVTFELDFAVKVPIELGSNYGAFAYVDGVLALAGFYPIIPVYDEGWNVEIAPTYGDITYTDTSLYLVRFTLPTGWQAAASGSALAVRDNGDGTTTWTFVTGPMRDFNLVASPEYVASETRVGATTVRSYYKPADAAGGQRALEYAARALEYFNEAFGPYPFAELDVAATPNTAAGIEYPGLIVIAQRLYEQMDSFFEWATVHETAHQWWYSLVGSDQVDEPWLDESLTQYVTLMYVEKTKGPLAAMAARQIAFERPYRQLVDEGRDQPVGQPVRAFSEGDYGAVVYAKGPLFFDALRRAMGDQAFRAFLRAYFEAYRYRIATPEALLATAGEVCRCDVRPIYEEWILGIRTTRDERE